MSDPLRDYIKRCEGTVKKNGVHVPYRCPSGALTIGWGHNLDANGITDVVAEHLLTEDLSKALHEAMEIVAAFPTLTRARQTVVVSMIYQLGAAGFRKFVRTIASIERGDYNLAARYMLESKWARDQKAWAKGKRTRAEREADMMRSGEFVQ